MRPSRADRCGLPGDTELPGVAWLQRRLRRAGPARRLEVVKHRPGRRMVVRESGAEATPTIYWKLYHNVRGDRLMATHHELDQLRRAGQLEFEIPEVVGGWPGPRAIALREVEGRPLEELVPPALEAAAEATGRALATLHRSGWRPARAWTLEDEAGVLQDACAHLASEFCAGHRVYALAARIEAGWQASGAAEVPLHRDFHPGQVLCGASGRLAVIDWDDSARGAGAIDVANLVGHLRLEALRQPALAHAWSAAEARFLLGYSAVETRGPGAALDSFVAGTLLRLAGIALERRRDREEALALIELAESALLR